MVRFFIQRMCWSGRRRFEPAVLVVALVVLIAGCAGHPPDRHGGYQAPMPERAVVASDPLWQVFSRYEGAPYRYGGTTASGFDCSGFIQTAYREAYGLQLPRTTSALRSAGYSVGRDQVRPGDLVFFRIRGKEQHAGIYMGNSRFIHASSSVGVTESSLSSPYWQSRLSRARRLD